MGFDHKLQFSSETKTHRTFTGVIGRNPGLLRPSTRKEQPTGLGSIISWREMRWRVRNENSGTLNQIPVRHRHGEDNQERRCDGPPYSISPHSFHSFHCIALHFHSFRSLSFLFHSPQGHTGACAAGGASGQQELAGGACRL